MSLALIYNQIKMFFFLTHVNTRQIGRSYPKVATKFSVDQPMTKDLSVWMLACPSLSIQLAVHMVFSGILFSILKFFSYLERYPSKTSVSLFHKCYGSSCAHKRPVLTAPEQSMPPSSLSPSVHSTANGDMEFTKCMLSKVWPRKVLKILPRMAACRHFSEC